MKCQFLLATLAVAAACTAPTARGPEPRAAGAPLMGVVDAVYLVQDDLTGARIGYLDRVKYDRGEVIFWVKDLDRTENRGYILPTGRAYKYVWEAGKRRPDPVDLGADTRDVGARRILGHDGGVHLVESSLEALLAELRAPAKSTAPAGGGDETSEPEDE
jgi:hypothetical protein